MSEDELIIELDSPPPPAIQYAQLAPDMSEIVTEIPDVVKTESFWLFSDENRDLLIHAVSDVILFYLFFQYICSKYSYTASLIHETEEQIKLMRKQYGIEKQKKKRLI